MSQQQRRVKMGKRVKLAEVIKVNPREAEGGGRRVLPCFQEMQLFMSCIKGHSFDMGPCRQAVEALNACMDNQASKGKRRSTINYHLQRIARQMRK